MRWRVEVITDESSNILVDDANIPPDEQEPVGMGFPLALANRIVKMHNETADKYEEARSLITDLPKMLEKLLT